MSALGQKQTFGSRHAMSAPKADIETQSPDVHFVPKADIAPHSITSSARASSEAGMVNLSALAVLRLMTISGNSSGHSSMSNLTPCASGSCIPKLTVLVARRI
jgi:hypothetical protein